MCPMQRACLHHYSSLQASESDCVGAIVFTLPESRISTSPVLYTPGWFLPALLLYVKV